MNQHPEIIATCSTVWLAPVGTAFPELTAEPGVDWTLVGSSGTRNYAQQGVTIIHDRNWASSTPAAETGESVVSIEDESLRVQLELIDLTLEQYTIVLGGNVVVSSPAAPGEPGTATIGLAQRTGPARQFAVLVRGPSPYDEGLPSQYEFPRACEAGSPRVTYRRGQPSGLAVEFRVLTDPAATSEEERFGRLVAQVAGALPPPPPAPFTEVAADGWRVTVASPTDLSLTPFIARRAAFSNLGVATTVDETLFMTKRVRNLFPEEDTFTADKVAISEPICAADTITGATNNSTLVSPKPIVTWGMADRELVGDYIDWEITGFHWSARLAQQLKCVWVRATDGTNTTDWQIVFTVSQSTSCEGPFPIECMKGRLSITGLTDLRRIKLDAKAFPHFGVEASVADTTTETEWRFSSRYFYKDIARAASPNIICVSDAIGNDATAVVSTDEATARATPAKTPLGAMYRAAALLGDATANALSGLQIRVMDGVDMGSIAFVYVNQDAAAIKITRASTATRASANITWSTAFFPYLAGNSQTTQVSESAIIFEDLTITRTADVEFSGTGSRKLHTQLRNVAMNFSGVGASSGMKGGAHLSIFGMTVTNFVGGLNPTSAGDNRMLRGLTGSFNDTTIDGYCVMGCSLNDARVGTGTAERGALIYNNHLPDPPGAGSASISVTAAVQGADMGGIAIVQNLVPMLKADSTVGISFTADGEAGNITHLVCHHNTAPGDGTYGRYNIEYDETVLTPRSHEFVSFKFNVGSQFNMKPRDTFLGVTETPGNFATHHGVSCVANYAEDFDAAAPPGGPSTLDFAQAYPGLGSVIGGGDPLYVDDNAVSLPGPVAGTPDGDYHLQSGSPAKNLYAQHLLTYDKDGTLRRNSGLVDAGCYA